MVTAKLQNAGGRLYGLPSDVLEAVSDECSFEVQGAEKSDLYRKKRWDGRKRMFDKQHGKFPIGLWGRISAFLRERGVEFVVEDQRTVPPRHLNVDLAAHIGEVPLEIRTYQRDATVRAIATGQSVVQVATGGGKTFIAALLVAQNRCNTLFMVHTKDLLYQAKRELGTFLVGQEIGQIGDGIVDVQSITIATMQTVAKHLGVKITKNEYDDGDDFKDSTDTKKHAKAISQAIEQCQMVIWDEVHRVACDTAYGVMEKVTGAYYRIGLSASPWRDDGSDLMIEAAMGATSYKISASQLIDLGYLVPPIIRRVRVPASEPWWTDSRSYDTIYKEDVVENEYRNHLIVEAVKSFLGMDIPTLVLVTQIKHGNLLKRMISEQYHPIDFISGRDLSQKRLQAIQGMREGEIPALIASTIADEGLDIKRLSGLILAGGGKSSTRALQRIGRTLRPFPGKTHALIVDLADEAKYLRVHAEKRKEIYLTEPRFHILET